MITKPMWKTIVTFLVQFFFIAISVFTILILYTMITRTWFSIPPLRVVSLTQTPNKDLCANETYKVLVEVTPLRTTLVSFYLVVRDEQNNHFVDRNQTPLFEIPTEAGITFTQELPWSIPNLPPGHYERILGVRGHDPDETPIIFIEGFDIGDKEHCIND